MKKKLKKSFLIFSVFVVATFGCVERSFAQILPSMTEREMLIELFKQQTEILKQQAEFAKQLAVTNAKLEALEKRFDAFERNIDKRFESVDKRFDDANKRMDMLFYMMLAMLTGIFGLIGFVVWDRQVSIKPVLEDNKKIIKELEQLAQREQRHEESVISYFKKLAQIDSRFESIL